MDWSPGFGHRASAPIQCVRQLPTAIAPWNQPSGLTGGATRVIHGKSPALNPGYLDFKTGGQPLRPVFGSNLELRALAEAHASEHAKEKFVRDFASAWAKPMDAASTGPAPGTAPRAIGSSSLATVVRVGRRSFLVCGGGQVPLQQANVHFDDLAIAQRFGSRAALQLINSQPDQCPVRHGNDVPALVAQHQLTKG